MAESADRCLGGVPLSLRVVVVRKGLPTQSPLIPLSGKAFATPCAQIARATLLPLASLSGSSAGIPCEVGST